MESTDIQQTIRLGDILIEQRVITAAQLNASLAYQRETGARLGDALTQLEYVTGEQIAQALSRQRNYGLSALADLVPNPSAVALLTERFARARQVLPVEFDKMGALMLAMVDPLDLVTIVGADAKLTP
jgi:MshEN domain